MAITSNATTLTFNNGSTQTVAPVNTNANVNSVSAGSGISVSATTGALTVTNSGVTSVSAGSGISVSASTGGVTISASATGTVTSVATGNGLQGGTITSSGTLSVACPGFNTVGSYCYVVINLSGGGIYVASGGLVSTGEGTNQITSRGGDPDGQYNNLSGTWRWMAGPGTNSNPFNGIACRVS